MVSIICLCHNHERFVEQAMESVLHQTYDNIELIVVDDASIDGSKAIIENMSKTHGFQTFFISANLGNCKSFNIGLGLSNGKYIIDLAADDQLLPERILEGVKNIEAKGKDFAVDFCDVDLIDENGRSLGTHFKRDDNGKIIGAVEEGDLYQTLVEKYYISAPSMMMRRTVLEKLNGYDENLSYEDFDFWVRSARNYKYTFTNKILVKKHILSNSLSSIQYKKKNRHCMSTALVCEKAFNLNKSESENLALLKRTNYELKWALVTENWEASRKFLTLKNKLQKFSWDHGIWNLMIKIKPPWFWFLQLFF